VRNRIRKRLVPFRIGSTGGLFYQEASSMRKRIYRRLVPCGIGSTGG